MRCGKFFTWTAVLMLSLALTTVSALADVVDLDTQDPYEYSYTWRVTDEGGDWLGGCAYEGRGPL